MGTVLLLVSTELQLMLVVRCGAVSDFLALDFSDELATLGQVSVRLLVVALFVVLAAFEFRAVLDVLVELDHDLLALHDLVLLDNDVFANLVVLDHPLVAAHLLGHVGGLAFLVAVGVSVDGVLARNFDLLVLALLGEHLLGNVVALPHLLGVAHLVDERHVGDDLLHFEAAWFESVAALSLFEEAHGGHAVLAALGGDLRVGGGSMGGRGFRGVGVMRDGGRVGRFKHSVIVRSRSYV